MNEEDPRPYVCHVLVCTNDRHGERASCADGNSPSVRSFLKKAIKERRWTGRVRVSQTGCMGLCRKGPNVIIYPQGIWFSQVSESDATGILSRIEALLEGETGG